MEAYIKVQNFGEATSAVSDIKLIATPSNGGDERLIASGIVRPLAPFEKMMVRLVCAETDRDSGKMTVAVVIEGEDQPAEKLVDDLYVP